MIVLYELDNRIESETIMMSKMSRETGYAEMSFDEWLRRLRLAVDEDAVDLLDCEDTQWLWSPEILKTRWFAGLNPDEYARFILDAYVLCVFDED